VGRPTATETGDAKKATIARVAKKAASKKTATKKTATKKTARKMLNIPFCAYWVQISTTFLESSTEALSPPPSSFMFCLMNSTAR